MLRVIVDHFLDFQNTANHGSVKVNPVVDKQKIAELQFAINLHADLGKGAVRFHTVG